MASNASEARRRVASSRTRRASPSTIRCILFASVVMTQRPSAARPRHLRFPLALCYIAVLLLQAAGREGCHRAGFAASLRLLNKSDRDDPLPTARVLL